MFFNLILAVALTPMLFMPRIVRDEALAAHAAKPCAAGTTRLAADLKQSKIRWRGTKFFGLGSHEGTVALGSGQVCLRESRIVNALFAANVRSLEVTDIPATDPVPRKRLRDHLLSEDFFNAAKYPDAYLYISDVRQEAGSLYAVNGTLQMRGVTQPVSFYARVWELTPTRVRADATIEVDRQRWGMHYRGSALKDDLADDEFTLHLTLIASAASVASN